MIKRNLLIIMVSIFVLILVFLVVYKGSQDVIITKTNLTKAAIGTLDDPTARLEYERRMLVDPTTGKIPQNIRNKELKFAATLPKVKDVALGKGDGINTLTWSKRGPINRGGRTRALAVDYRTNDLAHLSANTMIIIAGGASGGIYKSIDGGTTWVNKLSPDSIHSITCIAQNRKYGFEDTWYVGTGETASNLLGGQSTLFLGDGIYKSTDNGETWTLLPSTSVGTPQTFSSAFNFVHNIAITGSGTLFVAASNTIQKSADGGNTWTVVRGAFTNNDYSDVIIAGGGDIITTIESSDSNPGISRSTDGGVTWTNITPSVGAGFPTNYGRIVMASAGPDVVYFWAYTPGQGPTQTQLWKLHIFGPVWQNLTTNLPAPSGDPDEVAGIDVQGAYNMVIKAKYDWNNFGVNDTVVIGGTNLYRSTNGFGTPVPATGATNWIGGYAIANDITQYANHHPDQHAFVFGGRTIPNVALSGNDGGVSFSPDITAANVVWQDRNIGYVTSQFYAIDIDPNTSGDPLIAGGLQDNGNYIAASTNFNTNWTDWGHGGDGGYAAVRKTGAAYTVYLEAQNGWLWRQTYDASGTRTSTNFIQPSNTDQYAFVNPFILDKNDSTIMYFAQGDSVLRNNSVNTLTTSQAWSIMGNATTGSSVTALATSSTPANILYVGGSNGKILKITGANVGDPVATDISTGKGMPAGYVNCIAVDPTDANKIITVFSNYSVISLWLSNDGGTTWGNISGNLEENADGTGNGSSTRWLTQVTVSGRTIYYVATSAGLYSTSTLNGTSTVWAQEGATTIGNVVCPMVKGRDVDGLVVVATHGKGVFSATQIVTGIEDETTIPTNFTLSQNYPNPFNPTTVINYTLYKASDVELNIYNFLGEEVSSLVNKRQQAGKYKVTFSATRGASNLTSGIYFYSFRADNNISVKKMILLK